MPRRNNKAQNCSSKKGEDEQEEIIVRPPKRRPRGRKEKKDDDTEGETREVDEEEVDSDREDDVAEDEEDLEEEEEVVVSKKAKSKASSKTEPSKKKQKIQSVGPTKASKDYLKEREKQKQSKIKAGGQSEHKSDKAELVLQSQRTQDRLEQQLAETNEVVKTLVKHVINPATDVTWKIHFRKYVPGLLRTSKYLSDADITNALSISCKQILQNYKMTSEEFYNETHKEIKTIIRNVRSTWNANIKNTVLAAIKNWDSLSTEERMTKIDANYGTESSFNTLIRSSFGLGETEGVTESDQGYVAVLLERFAANLPMKENISEVIPAESPDTNKKIDFVALRQAFSARG